MKTFLSLLSLSAMLAGLSGTAHGQERDLIDRLFGVGKPRPGQSAADLHKIIAAQTPQSYLGACPPGLPPSHCRAIQNNTEDGQVMVVIRIDNLACSPYPYGGQFPVPRLLNGERTVCPMPLCTNRKANGDCVRTIVAETYESVITEGVDDPRMAVTPVVEEDFRHCYQKQIVTSMDGRFSDTLIDINYLNAVPCPTHIVPKQKASP